MLQYKNRNKYIVFALKMAQKVTDVSRLLSLLQCVPLLVLTAHTEEETAVSKRL